MHYEYQTKGTCSSRILFDIEDGKLKNVEYIGGCNGNLQGIGRLVEGKSVRFEGGCHGNTQGIGLLTRGMQAADVIARLEGIDCKGRGTSCPDQLATALEQAKAKAAKV